MQINPLIQETHLQFSINRKRHLIYTDKNVKSICFDLYHPLTRKYKYLLIYALKP
jgi:hypothetical protein